MERSWSVDRTNGVTLVRCRLCNDRDAACQVRVESRLDGPVLAPRRNGVPEDGWDRSGVTVRLDPGERRAVGFASPAEPTEPPVAVEVTGANEGARVSGDEGAGTNAKGVAACDAVRRLGIHRPPADVIEAMSAESVPTEAGCTTGTGDATCTVDEATDEKAATVDEATDADGTTDADGMTEEWNDDGSPADHENVDEWFTAIERRIERGERLTGTDLATATKAVEAANGVSAIVDLDRRLTDDATRLRRLSERAASLAARAEATDVPTDAMKTLAGVETT